MDLILNINMNSTVFNKSSWIDVFYDNVKTITKAADSIENMKKHNTVEVLNY